MRGGIVALAVALSLPGCATVLHGTTAVVPVQTTPAGAEVWVDGQLAGRTPLRVRVRGATHHRVELRLQGHAARRVELSPRVESAFVALDIALTSIVGVGIDALTGAWYVPSPGELDVTLSRRAPAAPVTAPGTPADPVEPASGLTRPAPQ